MDSIVISRNPPNTMVDCEHICSNCDDRLTRIYYGVITKKLRNIVCTQDL